MKKNELYNEELLEVTGGSNNDSLANDEDYERLRRMLLEKSGTDLYTRAEVLENKNLSSLSATRRTLAEELSKEALAKNINLRPIGTGL